MKKLIGALSFARKRKTARGKFIGFMAFMFGSRGFMDYGQGFRPEGYYWRRYFARETPWPPFD